MDIATGAIIAAFGVLGLFITLAAATLRQLPDLIAAYRAVQRSLRDPDESNGSEM
ncbi:hypothetical protein [Streptomyces sp. NPDC054863]